MGFDNECILNIQSLPGEYFCPVCRTLIFPNEALQSQCTHLYCKPCLAYIVATTHACPYDGYLVTEADSKPLLESNKSLAEAIGKVQVYCLYHRSGCQWQGTLSDCISHCTLCTFGNSPVVCNRCGTQIVHRQVQEHAQTCPGLQPQGQQVENAQVQALAASNHGATQDPSAAAALTTTSSTATVATTTIATTTPAVPAPSAAPTTAAASAIDAVAQSQNPQVAVPYQQSGMQAPTAEQWYRQQLQYQQYYQQYPGYDPYQQQYQQYGQFQQHYQQYPQTHVQVAPQQLIQGQQQVQQYVQSQPNVQPQPQLHSVSQAQQPQAGNQPQLHQQPVPQPQFQSQPQPQPQLQLQMHPQPQILPQPQPSTQPLTHPQPHIQTQQMAHSQFSQAQHVPVQQTHQQVQPQLIPQATQLSANPGQPNYHQLQAYPQAQQPVLHAQQHQPAALSQQLSQPPIQQQPPSQNQPRPLSLPQAQPYAQAQPQFQQPHIQQQPRPQPQLQPQTHHQPQPQPQAHPQPLPQLQPQSQHPNQSVHGVTGHQSYPQTPSHQQISHGMQQQQRPMHSQQPGGPQHASQSQLTIQQPPQIWPSQTHMPVQSQQYSAMPPHAQAPHLNAATNSQSNHLANQAGQQVHQPVGVQIPQQAFPQQQSLVHLQSAQPSQQGGFPSQPPAHSHPLRPQAQPFMQSQSNVPPAHGRSVATNQPLPQQVQHSPAKQIQAGFNQNHLPRQHGSIQQSQLNSGSQSSLVHTSRPGTDVYQVSTSGSDMKSTVLERLADSVSDKVSQVKQLEIKAGGNADGSETSRSSEHIVHKPENGSKPSSEVEISNGDIKENSESKENKDGLMLKQEVAADFQDGQDVSNVSKDVEGEKEVNRTEQKKIINLIPVVEGITGDSTSDGPSAVPTLSGNNKQTDKANQGYNTRSQLIGIPASSAPSAQPLPHVQLQHDVETHDKEFQLPGYHDRSLTQFPPPQSGQVGVRGISPTGPLLGHERYPPQSFPHGHPSNTSDAAMVSHKPSGPDRTFPQNIPQAGSNHDRRFEEPFPHPVPGPPTAHGQLRPPGYAENFPYPIQNQVVAEHFQPPVAKQPYGSSRNVEEINPFPVRSQVHGPPPSTVGIGGGQIDPLGRPVMGAPGYYDGRQSESRGALPGERVPFGQQTVVQPDTMKMNGLPGMGPTAGMLDSAFSHGGPDDRFHPPPGERFKSMPDEGFRSAHGHFGPMMADSSLHIANRREYEEGPKHFPRPSHFDGDGTHRFNAYGPVSGTLDRVHDAGSRPFDRASIGTFPHPSSGRFPPSSGASGFAPLEDRQRGPLFHEDLSGKHEVHPERIRPFSEFGRPHFDTLPPTRSPGILDGSGHFRTDGAHFKKEVDPFDISHNRLRPTDPVGLGLSNNIKGVEPFSARTFPGHLRFNDPTSHGPLRAGEPFGFGGYGRTPMGDSGFKSFPVHGSVSLHGDVDSFEHLRERKNINCGWCRLCKVDCETVEGLEVHSQTKDHQNMAMEIVLNIKKENAKKQKLTSEESDDTNKSWKTSFENRGGRH